MRRHLFVCIALASCGGTPFTAAVKEPLVSDAASGFDAASPLDAFEASTLDVFEAMTVDVVEGGEASVDAGDDAPEARSCGGKGTPCNSQVDSCCGSLVCSSGECT